jgi:hypothetical protein
LKRSISGAKTFLKPSSIWPECSRASLSISSVGGRARARPLSRSKLEKSGETTGDDSRLAALVHAFVAGDILEHFARNGGVAADDDEHRRRGEQVGFQFAAPAQAALVFFVVGVELVERLPHQRRQVRGGFADVGLLRLAALRALPLAGQFGLAVLVEVFQDRLVDRLAAVVDRQEGNLDQPGLDRFDQAEVADHPGEQRVRRKPRSGEVVGRRREIVDRAHLKAPGAGAQAGEPDRGAFVFGFRVVEFGIPAPGARQIAVVGFVIDHQQAASGLEAAQHAAQHLVFVLAAFDLVTVGAELAVEGRALVAAEHTRQELVIVGDDQAVRKFAEGVLLSRRHQRALLVVVAGGGGRRVALVRQKDIEPVADGDAGGDDQEVVGVAGVVAVFAPVEVVVEDQAGHDDGLAAAGGHLEGDAGQLAGLRRRQRWPGPPATGSGNACRCSTFRRPR